MSKLDRLYAKLPIWMQNAAVSTYGLYWHWLRFKGSYGDHLEAYRQRETFEEKAWEQYRQNKLRELLSIAYQAVPYYLETWSESQYQSAFYRP